MKIQKRQWTKWLAGCCALIMAAAVAAPAAHADKSKDQKSLGLQVAVVAARDLAGSDAVAQQALKVANSAMQSQPGYYVLDPKTVAQDLKDANLKWPFAPKQYPAVSKALSKVPRLLTVTVQPASKGKGAHAVVELFDTSNGGLVGRGEADYSSAHKKNAMNPVDGAILAAITDMSRPAVLHGAVISKPQAYRARISLGAYGGLRNGARIEYLKDGKAFAWGTVIDLGTGDSVATVAPEKAMSDLHVNTPFRTTSIPPVGLMGKSRSDLYNDEYKKFSKEFAIDSVLATVSYLIWR